MVDAASDTRYTSSVQVSVGYSKAGPTGAGDVPADSVAVRLELVDVFEGSGIDVSTVRIRDAFANLAVVRADSDAAREGVVSDARDLLATVDDDRVPNLGRACRCGGESECRDGGGSE